jgi:nickel-dependent lactate racemase
MAEIKLGYGADSVPFEFDASKFEILSTSDHARRPLSDVEINSAIDSPIESPALEAIVSPGETILIVVSDATRATASGQVVNLLVRRLIAAGVMPGDIKIVFATGIHRPTTLNEKQGLLTPFIFQRVRSFDHSSSDQSQLESLGSTSRGNPIELNRALIEHDHVFLTGGINFHYFAGFTGGRKSISPGLASARTITATHMLALDFDKGGRREGVGSGLLDGNAVSEECEEIAAKVNPAFLINTIVDNEGRALEVFAGHWREAHRAGCEAYAETHAVKIEERRAVVIASCGGAPYDINLIQAHKTLDMAAQACVEGGTIVLLAKCEDGLGRSDFLKWFNSSDSRELADRLRTSYEVNGQTAWALLTKAERFNVYLISDLPDEVVIEMRMHPAQTIAQALDSAGPSQRGYIMPRGSALLPISRT